MAASMGRLLFYGSQVMRNVGIARCLLNASPTMTIASSVNPAFPTYDQPCKDIMIMQTRRFAARKGTRDRKMRLHKARKLVAAARAAQQAAAGIVPTHHARKAAKAQLPSRIKTTMELTKQDLGKDNVYLNIHYKRQLVSCKEAYEMHKETHHPTVMNLPDAPLYMSLELDMSGEKKNKIMDNFTGIVDLPNGFSDGKIKTVIVFCKDENAHKDAIGAGAEMVGGVPLIKKIQVGEVLLAEYKYAVAHSDILNELAPLRGLLKKRFPQISKGTVSNDMKSLVEHYKQGIEYTSQTDNVKLDFGWVDIQVGTLNMTAEQIENNIEAIVRQVCTHRKPHLGPFVTAALLSCPPSVEKILIDAAPFLPIVNKTEIDEDEAVAQ